MAIELVAFDFDGTLVDTAPDIIRATNDFLELHGRTRLSDAEVIVHIGMGLVDLIQGVVPEAKRHPDLAVHVENQFSKLYDQYVLNDPRPFSGAEDFLKQWPKKVAIVSNKPQKYIHQILKHLNWDRFPWVAIVGGDTYGERKPHPMPLQEVMKQANVDASQTLMVGDGPPDMGVAKACGAHLLAVTFGYSPISELRDLGAEHWIGEFAELRRHIERLDSDFE